MTKFDMDAYAFYRLRYNYENYGIDGLKEYKTWKRYSADLKRHAVEDYLSGQYSQREITEKYELTDKSVLKRWIKKYNSHREIKATGKGMNRSMIKGRKKSLKEKIETVE